MTSFSRADRVSGLIQEALSDIIHKDISDPRLEMATITAVKMSRDLKSARVYFTVPGGASKSKTATKGFQSALGYLKRSLAGTLKLRYMPELKFFYDESFDYGSHIDQLLESVKSDDGTNHTTD
jgi:ribosome-binding factor A